MTLGYLKAIARRVIGRRLPQTPASASWDEVAAEARMNGVNYVREVGDGLTLGRYERNGKLDYETYRRVQEAGNKAKLDWVFTNDASIAFVANHARAELGTVNKILCHGTRNAAEQKLFQQHFPNAEIIGTEISETATQFPMTILWDFHETKHGWHESWDVLYSNSWDHAYDPQKMFCAWAQCLRSGGFLYLEHTVQHEKVNHLDLFGATPLALRKLVEACGLLHTESLGPTPPLDGCILVFAKD